MEVSGGREAMKVGKKLIIEYEVSSRKEAPSSGIVTLHIERLKDAMRGRVSELTRERRKRTDMACSSKT
ncbi:hypothetical protein V6N11_050496 [Hibiscus sabdariffa]|uniref:Uncharacterized protein n=1 Tax=Hibiscus sabdariffa TaxID=183260 RepID=A0ABR2TB02_9ROSI